LKLFIESYKKMKRQFEYLEVLFKTGFEPKIEEDLFGKR
jgi:hypothetical protein